MIPSIQPSFDAPIRQDSMFLCVLNPMNRIWPSFFFRFAHAFTLSSISLMLLMPWTK